MKTKTFTVVITSGYPGSVTEENVKRTLQRGNLPFSSAAIQVHEVNKTHTCDGCGKERRDVKACGRDADGVPDAPDLCFICRKEAAKGRSWSSKYNRYIRYDEATSYLDDCDLSANERS